MSRTVSATSGSLTSPLSYKTVFTLLKLIFTLLQHGRCCRPMLNADLLHLQVHYLLHNNWDFVFDQNPNLLLN